MRKFINKHSVIFLVIMLLLFMIYQCDFGEESSKKNKSYYDSISTQLEKAEWRQPYGTEFGEISKALAKNNIRVCGEYHIKLVGNSEYIVACTPDGKNWHYFVVWSKIGTVYRADIETEIKAGKPY